MPPGDFPRQVLAFHYAWYETPWGPGGRWAHWNEHGHAPERVPSGSGRRDAGAAHAPLDGLYDSADPAVLQRQLSELAHAGVDASVLSWWGREHHSERVLAALLAQAAGGAHRTTVYYETGKWRGSASAEQVAGELSGILERHAAHPGWLAVDGRPVLWLYVVHTLPRDLWAAVRDRLSRWNPFLVADVGDRLDPAWLELFDAYHTYNPVGVASRAGDLAALYRRAAEDARARGRRFAATVLPGYDDRMVREPGTLLPRADGGTYLASWRAALGAPADWVVITSYNEWHEGSEIEPSREDGTDYLALTRQLARAFKRG